MISDKALLFKQSPAKVRFHPLLAHEMPLSQGGVARSAGNPSDVLAIFFSIFAPKCSRKWNNHRHIRWTFMPMAVCSIRAFIRFLRAVVVCHFRAWNSIFHTPFLHHFGVEQYKITWSYIAAICAGNTLKSGIIGIYRAILRYRIRRIALDT